MENREPEVWKPIPGYEGSYEISSWGNIKSLPRIVKGPKNNPNQKVNSVFLKIQNSFGYNRVTLKKEGKGKKFRVCRLVVSIYLRELKNGEVVNHLDENKCNDYYKNLEIVTIRENTTYSTKNKTSIYKGVSYDKSKPKCPWVASFYFDGKTLKFGNFINEYEAYLAYLNALKEYGLENKYAENQ